MSNKIVNFCIVAQFAICGISFCAESREPSDIVGHESIIQKAKSLDIDSINALGLSNKSENIPVLLSILNEAQNSFVGYKRIDAARIALARLNNERTINEICDDLHSTGHTRQRAFHMATEVGGNEMIAAVAGKLDDPRSGDRDFDVGYAAPRHLAVVALSQMVLEPSAPKIDLERITYSEENVHKWKMWWNENRHKYESHFPAPDSRFSD